MEIYNHGCEVDSNSGDSRQHYDIMLKSGMKLYCVATDDNHNGVLENPIFLDDTCGGWIMIKAPSLNHRDVIAALDNGWFYSSTGPEIHAYYIQDGKLCINCSPVVSVFCKATPIGCVGFHHDKNGNITHSAFDIGSLKNKEPFLRFEIVDAKGKMAFTNPYYFD